MKKIIALALTATMIVSMVGCGTKAEPEAAAAPSAVEAEAETPAEPELDPAEMEPEDFEYPSNEFEARVNQFTFDSYDQIIGMLEGKEAYAFIKMMGADDDVLIVADETYDLGDGETMAATVATPYLINADGKYAAGSLMPSDDESFPLKVNEDGIVLVARCWPPSIEGMVLGDNGTGIRGVMDLFSIIDSMPSDESEPEKYIGFIREKNTVVDNDGEQIDTEDGSLFYEKMDEYDSLPAINFTVADGTTAKPFDASTIAGSYVNFNVEEYEIDEDKYDTITADMRLFINPDGTGLYSGQDETPYNKITGKKLYSEYGDGTEYIALDGAIILNPKDNPTVYVKSNMEVAQDEDSIMKVRKDYCHPEAKDKKVLPGTYKHAYAEEMEDGWHIFYDELVVADDLSATTMFQDVGPAFKSVKNGVALGEDGKEYKCVVSHDVISIAFNVDEEYPIYKAFMRVEE